MDSAVEPGVIRLSSDDFSILLQFGVINEKGDYVVYITDGMRTIQAYYSQPTGADGTE